MSKEKKIRECKDCGSEPVNHLSYKTSLLIDSFVSAPFGRVGGFIERLLIIPVNNLADKFAPRLLNYLSKYSFVKVGESPDDRDALRTLVLWEEANKRGIVMRSYRFFNLPRSIYTAKFGDKTLVFDTIPRPNVYSPGLAWMDDKPEFKRRCMEAGIPVSKGAAVRTWAGAEKLFDSLDKPLVVKPHIGSGTKHTTLHIQDKETLKKAYNSAKQLSPKVIVEEELIGDVYRPTLVNHKLIATLGRIPPTVTGDGKSSVRQLIELENKNPKRTSGPYFQTIKVTKETEEELAAFGHTLDSIPQAGEKVRLHQKINWSHGGTTYDVTDSVHPDNRELFERTSRLVGDCVVGFDFIIADISKSWKEQKKCGFIECNAMPFFDNHHLPYEGEPRNVAGPVWDLVFP